MFKHKKKKTGVQTPEYGRFSIAPEPKSESKPNPNYIPLASVKKPCCYETPCGWCTKWDKKCDKKIGCEKPKRGLRAKAGIFFEDAADSELDYIRSGKGLPPIGTNSTHGIIIKTE